MNLGFSTRGQHTGSDSCGQHTWRVDLTEAQNVGLSRSYDQPNMQNTALIILALALVTAAAPGKAASACDVQYTHVNNAWRAASNECCADENDDGRCLGPNVTDRSGWLKPTPNSRGGPL